MLKQRYVLRSVSHVWRAKWRPTTSVSELASRDLIGIPSAPRTLTRRSARRSTIYAPHANKLTTCTRT
eukprot:9473707-Pyramimonas_sp.AAC.1